MKMILQPKCIVIEGQVFCNFYLTYFYLVYARRNSVSKSSCDLWRRWNGRAWLSCYNFCEIYIVITCFINPIRFIIIFMNLRDFVLSIVLFSKSFLKLFVSTGLQFMQPHLLRPNGIKCVRKFKKIFWVNILYCFIFLDSLKWLPLN